MTLLSLIVEPINFWLAMIVTVMRHCLAVWTYVTMTVLRIVNFNRYVYHLIVDPFVSEVARFKTVFSPVQVAWYDPRCIRSFAETVVLKVWPRDGQRYHLERGGVLFRLHSYATDDTYENFKCVSFITFRHVLVLIAVTLLLSLGAYAIYSKLVRRALLKDPVGRVWSSRYIAKLISFTTQPLVNVSAIRSTFSNCIAISLSLAKNHTHALSAAIRSASGETIELICSQLGLRPYFIQLSKSDVKVGRVGTRSYYWGKDIGVKPDHFEAGRDDVVVMIDVDMYMDMPRFIASNVHTYMISTFQPTSVSTDNGNGGEMSFYFDRDDKVTYVVSGGATYNHMVWNYAGDVITVSSRECCGLLVRITVYNVDRRQIGTHHQIVCLTPAKTLLSPIFDISWLIGGDVLDRYRVACGDFARLKVKSPTGTRMSTGKLGHVASANIDLVLDDTIANMSNISKVALSLAQVKAVLNDTSNEEASILVAFHRTGMSYDETTVFPVSESIRSYQFDPLSYDPEAAKSMIPFMHPILDECFVPDRCKSNDSATVMGRITEVKPPDDLELTKLDLRIMKEFVDLLIPATKRGKGIPVDIDEVYARQNRPTQQRILDKAVNSIATTTNDPVKCFQKAEPYSGVKDPRNISTIPESQKLNYSQFFYAFYEDILKEQEWYAFGHTPLEIATRIAQICLKAATIANTDLSRFDGRVAKVLRYLEYMIMMAWVHPSFKDTLNELLASQQGQRCITKFLVKFWSEFSRLSGSPETAGFNSIDNAFMAFKAKRMTRIDGVYMNARQAWASLGVYGGDDGVTADVDPDAYVKACASVGQKLEIALITRGQPGVMFLSREYSPDVWFGSLNSMCDVRRQLSKLHVTPCLPPYVTPLMKLNEKMSGYYVSDGNTPLIGAIATLVVKAYGNITGNNGLMNYFAKYPEHEQFPNLDEGDWMAARVAHAMPDFDFLLFEDWITKCEFDNDLLLCPPMCVSTRTTIPEVKRSVVIDEDIILPPDCFQIGGIICSAIPSPKVASEDAIPEFANWKGPLSGPIEEPDTEYSPSIYARMEDEKPTYEPPSRDENWDNYASIKPIYGLVCKHIAEGNCSFDDRCNHIVKKQICYGSTCRFTHGNKGEPSSKKTEH